LLANPTVSTVTVEVVETARQNLLLGPDWYLDLGACMLSRVWVVSYSLVSWDTSAQVTNDRQAETDRPLLIRQLSSTNHAPSGRPSPGASGCGWPSGCRSPARSPTRGNTYIDATRGRIAIYSWFFCKEKQARIDTFASCSLAKTRCCGETERRPPCSLGPVVLFGWERAAFDSLCWKVPLWSSLLPCCSAVFARLDHWHLVSRFVYYVRQLVCSATRGGRPSPVVRARGNGSSRLFGNCQHPPGCLMVHRREALVPLVCSATVGVSRPKAI